MGLREISIKAISRFFLSVMVIVTVTSCLPKSKKDSTDSDCGDGTFNSVSRTCDELGSTALQIATVIEDSSNNLITLNYTDANTTQGILCTIISFSAGLDNPGTATDPVCACTGGVCTATVSPVNLFSGTSDFVYKITDNDGSVSVSKTVRVNVSAVNNQPTALDDLTAFVIEDVVPSVANQAFNVVDDDGDSLTYTLVAAPSFGSVTINNGTGTWSYVPTTFNVLNGTVDNFSYRANDGTVNSVDRILRVTYTVSDDAPVNELLTSSPTTVVEDVLTIITLDYSDEDNDNTGTACTATPTGANAANLTVVSGCTCDLATPSVCTVSVKGVEDFAGSVDLTYDVTNNGLTSTSSALTLTVSAVNDAPLPNSQGVTVAESATAVATTYAIVVNAALDPEGTTPLTYTIVASPLEGSLINCMNLTGTTAVDDLTCDYTPNSGNLSASGATATLVMGGTTYTAAAAGVFGNSITIEYENVTYITAGTAVVTVIGTAIHILINATDETNIEIAIAAHAKASLLVTGAGGAAVVAVTTAAGPLAGGTLAADSFTYSVTDGTTASLYNGEVDIEITSVDDQAQLCEYSKFSVAPECGVNGCTGAASPVGTITPSAIGLTYWHSDVADAVCYQSTGATSADWVAVTGFISDQIINERDIVIIDSMVVDEGGNGAEDAQTVSFVTATSSNQILVPDANIRVFYIDLANEQADAAVLGGIADESAGRFRIEVTPVGGQSGTANITISVEDSTVTGQVDVTFAVTVNPVSAIHGGWVNISSVGPRVDQFGTNGVTKTACTYNRDQCDIGSECTGTSTPLGSVVPDANGVIFHDTTNDLCYRSTGTTNTDWTAFSSVCNISPSATATECAGLGASCIGTLNVDPINPGHPFAEYGGPLTPSAANVFFYDSANNVCYRSRDNLGALGDWEVYLPSETTLTWEDFTVSGTGTITGWNVYRRLSTGIASQFGGTTLQDEPFDFDEPINKTVLGSSIRTYTDDIVNSRTSPVPNTVYFYEVRPVINSISTGTGEVFDLVRLISPPNNYVFVHRWIVNKKTCTQMNSATIDPSNNFRCLYSGPGEFEDPLNAGVYHYDIQNDLLVGQNEIGCPYSASPICDTADGACVGVDDPNGTYTAVDASIYYNRSNGKCYSNNGSGTVWTDTTINNDVFADIQANSLDTKTAKLPPLVYVSQENAENYCINAVNQLNTNDEILGLNIGNNFGQQLPNRKEQLGYSIWDDETLGDTSITTTEQGLSLNSASKCNSSSGSGLVGFSDSEVPDSNSFYSLPGILSSTIRSIATGTAGTTNSSESCQSRFGVQDHVGNVAEWAADRIECTNLSECTGVITGGGAALASGNTPSYFTVIDSMGAYASFGFDGLRGPCADTNSDGTCDFTLDTWTIQDETYNAGRFFAPLGVPAHTNFVAINPASDVTPFMLEIGSAAGITSTQLHSDSWTVNSHYLFAGDDGAGTNVGCGAMATGGSYLTGTGAGSYNFKFYPCYQDTYGYMILGEMALRDISNDAGGTPTISVTITDNNAATAFTNVAGVITIQADITGGITYTTLVNDINLDPIVNGTINAVVSGTGADAVTAVATTLISTVPTTEKFEAADVGFRCISTVDPTGVVDYLESN